MDHPAEPRLRHSVQHQSHRSPIGPVNVLREVPLVGTIYSHSRCCNKVTKRLVGLDDAAARSTKLR